LAINPTFVYALFGKATILAQLEKYDEALSVLKKVPLSNFDNNEDLQKIMAFILYNLGKIDDAKLYYEKAFKINANLTNIMSEKELIAINKVMNNDNIKQ
jgi:tetratricopeptide (TPR) repeat protein